MKSAKTVRLKVSFEYVVSHWNRWDSIEDEERHLGRLLSRGLTVRPERLRVERVYEQSTLSHLRAERAIAAAKRRKPWRVKKEK